MMTLNEAREAMDLPPIHTMPRWRCRLARLLRSTADWLDPSPVRAHTCALRETTKATEAVTKAMADLISGQIGGRDHGAASRY